MKNYQQTTPFSELQIIDFYTKFKALCQISKAKDHAYIDKRQMPYKKQVIDYIAIKTVDDQNIANGSIGVNMYSFLSGLEECRMYNQGILKCIFRYLDRAKKGFLDWDEFL